MKLNVRSMAISVSLVWGVLGMFLVGLGNLIRPGYGQGLLDLAASLYPGYTAGSTLGQVIIGTLYGLADGAVCGAAFAWLYNRCAATQASGNAPA